MKTLLFTGLAGVLASAPGTAIAAADSVPPVAPVDLSFASPTAIAAGSQGMKAPRAKMGGHRMRGQGMKMRGHKQVRGRNQMRGHKTRNRGHNGKRFRGHGRNRGGNFGYFVGGGFPTLGYSPTYVVQQPTYSYAQPQPSYYPVPYPVPTPVAYPALAPTAVVVETVGHKGKGLTKPAHRIAAQAPQQAQYDHRVIASDHHSSAPATHAGTTYQGDWDGAYREDGTYQGQWQGTYRDEQGRAYQGQYSGTFIGDGDARPIDRGYAQQAPTREYYEDDRRYSREQEEMAYLERCKKSSGIGGAVVGGAIGALAGNRIAGRGNRLGGSLIGGGVGALAGAAIERSTDRCRKLLKKYGYDRNYAERGYTPQRAPRAPVQSHHGYGYGYGWQGILPACLLLSTPATGHDRCRAVAAGNDNNHNHDNRRRILL